nr:hypothetical protein [Gemmatimonadaceae bacterium]
MTPLAKLRGRSPRELADRLAHRVRLEADRRRVRRPTVLPIDGPSAIVPVPTLDGAALRARLGPDGTARVLARADAVLARRFPLLGHDALDYGDPPDWHRD